MTELLPCPFCGGEADLHHDAMIHVECLGCTASAYAFDQSAAIAAWNRRAPVWQPIATAPEEGQMLGWGERDGVNVVDCDNRLDRNGGVEYFNGDVYCVVTHWQPLPAPPQEPTNE